jgi:hypothetical protein
MKLLRSPFIHYPYLGFTLLHGKFVYPPIILLNSLVNTIVIVSPYSPQIWQKSLDLNPFLLPRYSNLNPLQFVILSINFLYKKTSLTIIDSNNGSATTSTIDWYYGILLGKSFLISSFSLHKSSISFFLFNNSSCKFCNYNYSFYNFSFDLSF